MRPRSFTPLAALCLPLAAVFALADTNDPGSGALFSERLVESHARPQNISRTTGRKRRSKRRTTGTRPTQKTGGATTGGSESLGTAPSQLPTSRGPLSGVTYELPIRKPAAGEEQLQGLLTRVDCPSRDVIFSVKAGERTLKLWTPSLNRVQFRTYTSDVSGDMTCGPRIPANAVVVTFRSAKEARAKFNGELVAVEFVPKDFVLKK